MSLEIEEFGDFAETKLNNHLIELHTRYTSPSPYTDEMITEEYKKHRELLSIELEQKLETLFEKNNLEPVIRQGLLSIKRKYENNLIWNKK